MESTTLQLWIALACVAVATGFLARRAIRLWSGTRNSSNPASGCGSGCGSCSTSSGEPKTAVKQRPFVPLESLGSAEQRATDERD